MQQVSTTTNNDKFEESIENRKEENEEEEVIDDWGLSNDDSNFHLFAQHEIRTIYMMRTATGGAQTCETDHDGSDKLWKSFSILCVEALTPIDMIDLGYGIHDATCHCVWTGAFLLIAALSSGGQQHNLLYPYIFGHRDDDNNPNHNNNSCQSTQIKTSPNIECHRPIHILELGSGTGIGSIGIWMAYQHHYDNSNNITNNPMLHFTMTDADPEALKLCQQNCVVNHIPECDYNVDILVWGEELVSSTTSMVAQSIPYNVVFATDVLYDISLLLPLLKTAYDCLCYDGYFILSHIPRACYKSTHPAVSNLNEYIVHSTTTTVTNDGGFQFIRMIYPNECHSNSNELGLAFPKDALNTISLQEMEDIGAAIFIFQKKKQQKIEMGCYGESSSDAR